MLETGFKARSTVLSLALASASLCAFGQITDPPHPALASTAKAMVARPQAATASPVLMKDVDEPGRAPFQVTVPISMNNFVFTPVAIPAGQRLVIDHISYYGNASGPNMQPLIELYVGVGNGPAAFYLFASDPSPAVPGQYYHNENATIYADSLQLAPAYGGNNPNAFSFFVTITGHLITP